MKPSTALPSTTKKTEAITFTFESRPATVSTEAGLHVPAPEWVHRNVPRRRRRFALPFGFVVGLGIGMLLLVGWPRGWFDRPRLSRASAEPIRVNLLEDDSPAPTKTAPVPQKLPSMPREPRNGVILRTGADEPMLPKAEPKIAETPMLKFDVIELPKDLTIPIVPMVSETPKVAPKMDLVLPGEPTPIVPSPMPQPAQSAQPMLPLPPVISDQPMPSLPLDLNLSPNGPGNTVNSNPPMPKADLKLNPKPELKLELNPEPPPPMPTPMAKTEVLPVPMEAPMTGLIEPEPTVLMVPTATRGTPMTRLWKDYGLRAVLTTALLTTMATVADAQDPKTDPKKEIGADDMTVTELRKQLEKVTALVTRLEKLEMNLNAASTNTDVVIGSITTDLSKLKKQVSQIQVDLNALTQKVEANANKIVAKSSPMNENPGMRTGNGRVLLKNDYLEEMMIIVNGTQYRLVPGQELSVTVPSGSFNYQVPQLQSLVQTRRLASDETYTIRVHPQR